MGPDGGKPVSGATEDGRQRCASCGVRIDTGEWHPVGTDRTPEGELVLLAFCSATCREAWIRR